MIEGINTSAISSMSSQQRVNYKMTEEQKTSFAEIIASYDTANMSDEDMMSLRQELSAEGIKPGEDLKGLMETAGVKGTPPPPPPGGMGGGMSAMQSVSEEEELPETLSDFIEKFKSGEVTEEDLNTLVECLQSENLAASGNIVNEKV